MVPKYRAFLTETKTIHDVLQIDLSRSMVSLKIENASEWYWFKEVVLMQSTGLKDKNGVEIFEGDILNYGDYKNSHEVIFKNGYFWGHAIGEKEQIGIGLFNALEDLEVCGNIYENPELLDQSNES